VEVIESGFSILMFAESPRASQSRVVASPGPVGDRGSGAYSAAFADSVNGRELENAKPLLTGFVSAGIILCRSRATREAVCQRKSEQSLGKVRPRRSSMGNFSVDF
jgi:hypothetical protein